MRKKSFFNYEFPALTAELQARRDQKVKHSKPQVTNPECVQIRNERAHLKDIEKRFGPRFCGRHVDLLCIAAKSQGCNLVRHEA
jgi:hypothetical protein